MRISGIQRAPETALDKSSHLQASAKTVEFSALRAGQVLAQDLHSGDGTVIAPANTRLTPMLLARLLSAHAAGAIGSAVVRGE